MQIEVVRDPLWNNIRLDPDALAVLDTPAVQRLRYVRQLGHAFLVYPGATHTRFEHALGAYHLARRALVDLRERGELQAIPELDPLRVRLAALLHDVGHYPFSHTLEELGLTHHEVLAATHLAEPSMGTTLERIAGPGAVDAILALVRGQSESPLANLISGTLDLDKIEYLTRDARMCGVPYGAVDVDRLIASLCVVSSEDGHPREVGVDEKGLSALESLLFAKYQMFRNVYWHHAVRAASCMFKRLVRSALDAQHITLDAMATATDDGLTHDLIEHDHTGLAAALRERKLYKRALDIPAAEVPTAQSWLATNPDLTAATEDVIAAELGLSAGAVLLDFPAKPDMLSVDLPLRRRDGSVERLTGAGQLGHLGLPRIADELYQSARRFRVFTRERIDVPRDAVIALVSQSEDEVEGRLRSGTTLLT